ARSGTTGEAVGPLFPAADAVQSNRPPGPTSHPPDAAPTMPFLHTALIFLLPLAAIPIVLHLLTLHRLKTVELSTFRFLFDSYIQQRRRMQFLEALLAALRTLFLLLLVMLICRPAIKHWNEFFSMGTGREVVMLVDC